MSDGSTGYREFDLRELVRSLRRRWVLIVGTAAVFVAGSLVLSYLEKPVYQASASVRINTGRPDQILQQSSRSAADAQRAMDTEILVAQSPDVRKQAAEALGHSPSVSVSAVGNTDVLAVRATSGDPDQAAADANAYANAYLDVRRQQNVDDYLSAQQDVQRKLDDIDQRVADKQNELDLVNQELIGSPAGDRAKLEEQQSRLERELKDTQASAASQRDTYQQFLDRMGLNAQLSEGLAGSVLGDAGVPSSPVKPTPVRNAAAALFIGLIVGVAVALVREYWDDSIKTKADLEAVAPDLSVLGLIPHVPDWRDRKHAEVVTRSQPSSPAAEAYRSLRTSVKFLGINRPIHTLQVTSSVAGEGKSTTVANIAVAFARSGSRVIVVCCDLRRPRLHEFFGLSNVVGFTSVLLGEASVKDAVQQVPNEDRLLLLSAGPTPPNPSELLSSPKAAEVLHLLAENADLVIIDSPPVVPVTDGIVIAGIVDATVLVATSGMTTKRAYGRAVELLGQVNAPVVGTVYNDVSEKSFGTEYGYQYGYAPSSVSTNGGNGASRAAATRAAPSSVD